MAKKSNLWEHLWYLLKDNFPEDSDEELEMKLNTLQNYDDSWYGKSVTLYVPKFHGIVMRVGIRCEETSQVSYFSTDAERELDELLKP